MCSPPTQCMRRQSHTEVLHGLLSHDLASSQNPAITVHSARQMQFSEVI